MELNKQLTYKKYRFNVNLVLDTTMERRIDGLRRHTITINCMDFDNYYSKIEVDHDKLQSSLDLVENQAKSYVDAKQPKYNQLVETLIEFGFEVTK